MKVKQADKTKAYSNNNGIGFVAPVVVVVINVLGALVLLVVDVVRIFIALVHSSY